MSEVWKVMWESLPPGFRFHPTDEEFVKHYLMNYVLRKTDGFDVIPAVDDLFKRDPWELPLVFRGSSIIRSKDPEWWFLSTLKFKSAKSHKFDRRTSTGSWKITGKPKEIRDRRGNRPIAMKRNLVFCQNPRNEETTWIFHQYHLQDVSLGLTLREQRKYVLCHLVNRQYDYAETLANMEVDLEYEGRQLGLSEEVIQAKVRSLTEWMSTPPSDASLHKPQIGTMFMVRAVDYSDDMEQVMSTSSGDEDILDIINKVALSTDGESVHSEEFEVASDDKPLVKLEETLREPILKENRRGMPPDTLQGYIFVDETRQSVEEEFHRTEAGDASSLQDCQKDARPDHSASLHRQPACYPRRTEPHILCFEGFNHQITPEPGRWQGASPGRYHEIKETKASKPKATCMQQSEVTGPHPQTLVVRRNTSNRLKTSRSQQKNEETRTTSRTEEGCRSPFDYLVNLGAGTVGARGSPSVTCRTGSGRRLEVKEDKIYVVRSLSTQAEKKISLSQWSTNFRLRPPLTPRRTRVSLPLCSQNLLLVVLLHSLRTGTYL